MVLGLLSLGAIAEIELTDFRADDLAIHIIRIQDQSNFLAFVDCNAWRWSFHIDLNVLTIHDFNSTDATIHNQFHVIAFVHLQRFEFFINSDCTPLTVLNKKSVLHLDLSRSECYFLVLEVGDQPVYSLQLFLWLFLNRLFRCYRACLMMVWLRMGSLLRGRMFSTSFDYVFPFKGIWIPENQSHFVFSKNKCMKSPDRFAYWFIPIVMNLILIFLELYGIKICRLNGSFNYKVGRILQIKTKLLKKPKRRLTKAPWLPEHGKRSFYWLKVFHIFDAGSWKVIEETSFIGEWIFCKNCYNWGLLSFFW